MKHPDGSILSELWVCFEPPLEEPPPHALVLSFVAPAAEANLEKRCVGRMVSGRGLVDEVRPRGRAAYLRLIARIGSEPSLGGRTLRQVLRGSGDYSRWWLLDVTEKDCLWDDDTIFLTVLQLTAVRELKERYRLEHVHLHGAVPAFAAALGHRAPARGTIADLARAVCLGLLGRLALIVEFLGLWWLLRSRRPHLAQRRDVLLQAYWDWTVQPDRDGGLKDRYFTDLPSQLTRRGLSVGWLASCEPSLEPWQRGRRRRDVVAASYEQIDVTLMERYLTPADILGTTLNLRDPVQTTRVVLGHGFHRLCLVGTFNLYPLIRRQLLRAVWGRTFCRLQLLATATARACRYLRPGVVLTAFELFLRSRALYAGIRAYSPRVRVWAAQHAGYSNDKTFGVLEPGPELRGTPDGCPMPAPDGIFVQGDLSRRIWEASGFPHERVVLTGGLRYQAVRVESRAARPRGNQLTLLLACGMCEAAHVDFCDAVLAAVSGLTSMRVLWRDHPNYLFSRRPAFRRFRGLLTVTSGTLEEDLQAADLLMFTQTGLAEEALIRGIPTWQWLWPGFNTSPFLDIKVIPSFTSVVTLRTELLAFVQDPGRYRPAAETQRHVLNECFGPNPSNASVRIADALQEMIAADARASA